MYDHSYGSKHNNPYYLAAIERRKDNNKRKYAAQRKEQAKQAYPEAVAILENGESHASDFIREIAYKFNAYGYLSENQAKAVVKTAKAYDERKNSKPKHNHKTESLGEGALMPLVMMFEFAKGNKKFPSVVYKAGDRKIKMYPAGNTSKWEGWIQIKSGNDWFGRIDPKSGELHKAKSMTAEVLEAVKEFAADPLQAASAYGHMTGECCFCRKTLTDEVSKEYGYGPVCAKNHGLEYNRKKDK